MQVEDLPREVLDFLEGVVLEARKRPLNEGEKYVLRGIWAGQTYDEMVDSSGGKYTKGYLMQSAGPKLLKFLGQKLGLGLNKGNFRAILENKVSLSASSVDPQRLLSPYEVIEPAQSMSGKPTNYFDETLDVSNDVFFGRSQELAELNAALLNPQLRLTILRGFAGIGKSSLAYLAASQQKGGEEFDAVIFKSLRRRRTTTEFVQTVLQDGFNLQEPSALVEGLEPREAATESINELIRYLSDFRCLVVIDNFDTVFSTDGVLGFDDSSESYRELVDQIASAGHKSHILITCRAFPQSMFETSLTGRPVRQIDLLGLESSNVQKILDSKNLRDATQLDVKELTSRLGGVPLGVRLAAAEIQNRYSGSLTRYLANAKIPESLDTLIRNLIDELAQPEQTLLYRIASYGRSVAYSELSDDISDDIFENLKGYIESLRGRSLLAFDDRKRYGCHPLVAEISRENALKNCFEDIRSLSFDRLDAIILVKSSADEFDRLEQTNSILQPLQAQLKKHFSSDQAVADQLKRCLETLQRSPTQWRRYAAGNIFNLLRYLDIDREGWDLSGLVLQQADFRGVNLRRTNFANTELIDCVLPEALGCPDAVVFSPKEDKIAVGDADGKLRIWRFDGTTWQFDRAFAREHAGWVWSLAFSPDGELLASGGDDGTVRLWRVNGKKNRSFLPPLEHSGSIQSVAFSSDFYCGVRGNDRGFVLAANDEGVLKIWDAGAAFDPIADSGFEDVQASRIATSPVHDQMTFATASEAGMVQLWSWSSKKLELIWELALHNSAVYALAFSPDGQCLATGAANGTIGFWHVATGESTVAIADVAAVTKHCDAIWSIAFSRDGEIAASAGYDREILLWDTINGNAFKTLKSHKGKVLGVSFNQTARLAEHILVSASDDKTVRSWRITPDIENLENWNVQSNHVFEGLTSWIWQLAFSASGDILAAACDDGQALLLRCHEQPNGEISLERMGALKVDRIRTWAVAFNPKGDLLATGGSDNQVKLWDLETTTQVDLLAGHTDPIRALAYSADGQILASTSADSTVILWDLRDLDDYLANYRRNGGGHGSRASDGIVESIATLTEHAEPVWAVTFSHDDRILATAGESGEIILRRFDQGTDEMFRAFAFRRKSEVKTDILEGHTDTVWALAFSPDDTLLASCSSDRTIKLWDSATNLCIATLEGHTDQVHAISISADGQFLISGGNDAAIRIWDIQKQELIRTLEKAHQHWIWAVACHPMFPSLFASGSIDELISLRETSGKEVSQFLNQPFSQCNIRELICSSQEKDRFLGWGATDQEVKIV